MKSNINQGRTSKNLHNALSDCAYLFKNLRFLTVTVSEIVEQLKKVHTIIDNVLVLNIFQSNLLQRTAVH